jgi:flagellar hook-basal body complex protein FliE
MEINNLSGLQGLGNVEKTTQQANLNNGPSFQDMLKDAMHDVNNQQVQAYDAMQDIATGRVENLQKAIQQIEEADLSLKLALETKNKAIAAYKQVMQMQV